MESGLRGSFQELLLPGGLPAPSHPAWEEVHLPPPEPEGSPLNHTSFQLRILLLEKENAAPTSPSSLSSLQGLKREKLFSKEVVPTHG